MTLDSKLRIDFFRSLFSHALSKTPHAHLHDALHQNVG
jgi:hypothetical protein